MIPLNKFWQGVWQGTSWTALSGFLFTLLLHWGKYDLSVESLEFLGVYYVVGGTQMVLSMIVLTWAPREGAKDV